MTDPVHSEANSLLRDSLKKQTIGPRWVTPLIVIVLTLVLILFAVKPRISVPGDYFTFEVVPFRQCVLTFAEAVHVDSYLIQYRTNGLPSAPNAPGSRQSVDGIIHNLAVIGHTNTTAMPSNLMFLVTVEGLRGLNTEVADVTIDGRTLDLHAFSRHNMQGSFEYIRQRYLRKLLADWLYQINDPVSNVALTLLAICCGLIAIQAIEVTILAYIPNKYLGWYLKWRWKLQSVTEVSNRQCNEDKCNAICDWQDRTFLFMQALGPAVGFLLTVSSLVAALHPALRASNNLDAFMTGIHVAMISTFLGLLLRIIALWGERMNHEAYERAILLLSLPTVVSPNQSSPA